MTGNGEAARTVGRRGATACSATRPSGPARQPDEDPSLSLLDTLELVAVRERFETLARAMPAIDDELRRFLAEFHRAEYEMEAIIESRVATLGVEGTPAEFHVAAEVRTGAGQTSLLEVMPWWMLNQID